MNQSFGQAGGASSTPIADAYAVRDEAGKWYGEPDLLSSGYVDRLMSHPFKPSDMYNPLWGQALTMRCGHLPDDGQPDLNRKVVETGDETHPAWGRLTNSVEDALYGPRGTTSPSWREWQGRRELRRRELESNDGGLTGLLDD